MDNKGTQYLMKYEWTEGEWDKHEIVLERFKANIQPKGRNSMKEIQI